MTLELRETTHSPQWWLDVRLRYRVGTVFVNCAHVDPSLLPALASVFSAYLVAGRPAAPQRPHNLVAQLGGVLNQAEQSLERGYDAPLRHNELSRLEAEAAEVLADVRDVVRDLAPERPAAQRLRRAVLGAWGRYEEALAELRRRWDGGRGRVADLAVIARRRDVLLRNLTLARARET
jgi:hypothetical protein